MRSNGQGVFISYRREDSAGYARALYNKLREHFGERHIFMDVDAIAPGLDFVDIGLQTLSEYRLLVFAAEFCAWLRLWFVVRRTNIGLDRPGVPHESAKHCGVVV